MTRPVEGCGGAECPECGEYTVHYVPAREVNACHRLVCRFEEKVDVPQQWSVDDLRDFVATDSEIQEYIKTKVREEVAEAIDRLKLPSGLGGLQRMG